jgi:polygalacturonase
MEHKLSFLQMSDLSRRSFCASLMTLSPVLAQGFDVTRFGALADGKTNSRSAIQRAIDECSERGGGVVRLPAGRFVTGSLRLRSGVALWLDHGAVLAGSSDPGQYEARQPTDRLPPDGWECALLLAENIERAAILGHGTITGAGFEKARAPGKPREPFRPRLISFEHCQQVRVEGITLRDPDRWALHFFDCDSVQARSLHIRAPYTHYNTDGIDVDGSRNVVISGCEIVTGDDCIVLKTTNYLGEPRPCENVTVSNCTLSTRASTLKIGTETHANFSNIVFNNCTVFGSGVNRPDAVCIEAVDGARVRGVSVSNIAMRHVGAPVFVRLGARCAPSRLEDVVITNIVAVDAETTSSLTGIPSHAVREITISDARLVMAGGGGASLAGREVPERESAYPQGSMFGPLPAYGFYIRHARGVRLRNISISCEQADARPALIADDVAELIVDGLYASGDIRLKNADGAAIQGRRGPGLRGSRFPSGRAERTTNQGKSGGTFCPTLARRHGGFADLLYRSIREAAPRDALPHV